MAQISIDGSEMTSVGIMRVGELLIAYASSNSQD